MNVLDLSRQCDDLVPVLGAYYHHLYARLVFVPHEGVEKGRLVNRCNKAR